VTVRGSRGALLALLDHPLLEVLEALDIIGCKVTPDDLHRLATKRVASLALTHDHLEPAHVTALAGATALTGLLLQDRPIRGDVIEALVSSSALTQRLRRLHLHGGEPGVATVVASTQWQELVDLALLHHDLDDAGTAVIASSPQLAKLERLGLAFNRVGDAGAAAIASSPQLAKLERLDLSFNFIGDRGVAALAASRTLSSLRALALKLNADIGPGASVLAEPANLPALEELSLEHVPHIGEEALARLKLRFGSGLS
jgi:hypothetical protein